MKPVEFFNLVLFTFLLNFGTVRICLFKINEIFKSLKNYIFSSCDGRKK